MARREGVSPPLREEITTGAVRMPIWKKAKAGDRAVAFIDTGEGVIEVETKLDSNGKLVHPKMERGWIRIAHTHVDWLIDELREKYAGENPTRSVRRTR